ncbi:MAG: ribosome hibernation-promoting factor, HPF/YfiA family [Alphaproteobacteria bacterium]
MELQITGKNVDIGQALPQHIKDSVKNLVEKYFKKATDARVIMQKNGGMFKAEIQIHVNKYINVDAHGLAGDAYSAFELALEHVAKMLRRKKRMAVDNHQPKRH